MPVRSPTAIPDPRPPAKPRAKPSKAQRAWLARQPGGKLPLFDTNGTRISRRTVEACMAAGWCVRWFDNPTKPDWLVCRLTEAGRRVAGQA